MPLDNITELDTSNKLYYTEFEINTKMLAIVYVCYKYKFPLSFFLTFYELYGDTSMFALKALSCCKKIRLTDNTIIKVLDESKQLYKQILIGISTLQKIKDMKMFPDKYKDEEIPAEPKIDTTCFSDEYKEFVDQYLLKNIDNMFTHTVRLRLSTNDLYKELEPCEI